MDADTFDRMARRLSGSSTRRGALKALTGGALGALLILLGNADAAAACLRPGRKCDASRECCDGARCKGGRCRCKPGLSRCATGCCPPAQPPPSVPSPPLNAPDPPVQLPPLTPPVAPPPPAPPAPGPKLKPPDPPCTPCGDLCCTPDQVCLQGNNPFAPGPGLPICFNFW